jgi:hypothetical protein
MTRERLEELFDDEEVDYCGSEISAVPDNALAGLELLRKYKAGGSIIEGAGHEIIYSFDIDKALKYGLTEEDAIQLAKWNWMLDKDSDCLACFV